MLAIISVETGKKDEQELLTVWKTQPITHSKILGQNMNQKKCERRQSSMRNETTFSLVYSKIYYHNL